jgi:uncharacterized protein YbjT (DUF2867 family)
MKIIITGSLGNISRPLAATLVQRGHDVTVVSSDAGKRGAIAAIGAKAAIGRMEDGDFIMETFRGADAVYCMIPFNMAVQDLVGYFTGIAGNYVQAIRTAGIQRVVNLSGWAAGVLKDHDAEGCFDGLTGVTHLRPGVFYSNFYGFIEMIKKQGMVMANYGGKDMIALVAPEDIADAAVEELERTGDEVRVRYVASDEKTCDEVAQILGAAIGQPDLRWPALPAEQVQQGMEMMGMPKALAAMLVEMQQAIHTGAIQEKYLANRPVLGKKKLVDFAREFAVAYK